MGKGRYPIAAVVSRETGEVRLVYRENGTDEEFMGILNNFLKAARMIEEFDADNDAREQRQLPPGQDISTHAPRTGSDKAWEQRQLSPGLDVSSHTPASFNPHPAREATRPESQNQDSL